MTDTTHEWARGTDLAHLAEIREQRSILAHGTLHLVHEVLAYAADEAVGRPAARCAVTRHPDGSISVADDGRGTDTRVDDDGHVHKKPVMSTKDLRFFDHPEAQGLPDGRPRRGMSVVAALSEWLVHVNRRQNGSWTQRYEHGVPVTDLVRIADDGTRGTTVHFLPDDPVGACDLSELAAAWPLISIGVVDLRPINV